MEVENNPNASVEDLKTAILKSGLTSDYDVTGQTLHLSLDGHTAIDETSNTLADLGLVNGDLLYIILPSDNSPRLVPSTSSVNSTQSTNEPHIDDNITAKRLVDNPSQVTIYAGGDDSTVTPGGDIQSSRNNRPIDVVYSQSSCDVNMASQKPSSSCLAAEGESVSSAMEEDMLTDAEINCYLKEPRLIRDSTHASIPPPLLWIYEETKAQSQGAALAVLLQVLMKELGFEEQDKDVMKARIRNWNGKTCLQLIFTYPDLSTIQFHLLFVPMHILVVIHGRTKLDNNEVCNLKMTLTPSDYINSFISDDPVLTYKTMNLPKLSILFTDAITYPLLQFALTGSGCISLPGLSTVFPQVQFSIIKFLNVESVVSLSKTCKRLNDVCKDKVIWRNLCFNDFGQYFRRISDKNLTKEWYDLYRDRYIEMKRNRRLNFHPFLQKPYVLMPPVPTFPPSIYPPFEPFPYRNWHQYDSDPLRSASTYVVPGLNFNEPHPSSFQLVNDEYCPLYTQPAALPRGSRNSSSIGRFHFF